MTSNMLAGERRWNARRSGMTVLGKVTVPKPLNLPSQRLENHGLDPSVEIVPKGTLGWGSRPSSSGSNAWISSVSPNGDGGNTSPNHLSGRPSSSGSGTRPSTAGIDRTHEPVASAWGSNSRPSSASGTIASNQSSLTSLRPRSAETRPNSSQRSRFAEPVSESPVAWGPSSAAERLGVKSSKEDGFSLSSGDFPTLGSEKDNMVKNLESQDHSRPSSASERRTPSSEDAKHQVGLGADPNYGPVNSWRNDGSRVEEDGVHPVMERKQGEPQPYFNANVAPQHFDTWRGPPPVNVPDVWYGGPPRGPAFGPPGASGGYPMEPFPYYHRPQIPPALAGSQPIPPPGGGPRGPHPNNVELYRPHMPDSYARPGMPYRPGYYPGPRGPHGPMAFDGYYRPMGYCNNEREISYMGMPAAPPVYNCYPGPNGPPDTVSSHGRAGGHALSGKRADHLEDTGGPKRVSVHKRSGQDQRDEREDWEHSVQRDASHPGKGFLPVSAPRNYEWGADADAEREMSPRKKTPTENSSLSLSYRDQYTDSVEGKSFGGMQNASVDDGWTNKPVSMATFSARIPQLPVASERELPLPPVTKDPVLMQRIEGLNAKVRASDGREALNSYHREEQMSRSKVADQNTNSGSTEVMGNAGDFVPIPKGVIDLDCDKQVQSMVVPRRQYHGGQGRGDHRGKGKLNDHDTDGWRRKPRTPENITVAASSIMESVSGPSYIGEGAEVSPVSSVPSVEGESVSETRDSTDKQAQLSKKRELAKRALQLQKEEEDRLREQKARALAKLAELNKRTQTGESAPVTSDIQGESEESHVAGSAVTRHPQSQPHSRNLILESDSNVFDCEQDDNNGEKSVVDVSPHSSQTDGFESNASHAHTLPVKVNTRNDGRKASPQSSDGGTSMHKRAGYKQKQSTSMDKGFNEKCDPNSAIEAHNNGSGVTAVDNTSLEAPSSELDQSTSSNVHDTSNTATGSSTSQRKKVNKSNKNKHRVDDPSPPVISDSKSIKESKATLPNLDTTVSTSIEPVRVQALEAPSALPAEEPQSRSNSNFKPQPPRRMPRNQQANSRFTEKVHSSDVVWAPVRTQNRAGDSVETSQKSMEPECSTKSGSAAQNNYKGKRAEMEKYVPKPVAKELAQQGSASLVSSSVSSPFKLDEIHWTIQFGSINPESTQEVSSTNAFAGSSSEVKEGDARHNKSKKEHGHWKKRGTEPAPVSESKKDTQQSSEQNHSVKSDKNLASADIGNPSSVDMVDRSNMSNSPSPAGVSRSTFSKDQGATGRGKKRMPAPRRDGNNADHESSVETDKSSIQLAAPDVNHNDRTLDSKEHRSMGDRSSQWKPKSYPNSANNQQTNKTGGSQTVTTETNKSSKNDHSSQRKVVIPSQHDNIDQPQQDQSFSDINVAEGSMRGPHQVFNREKKHTPAKVRSSFSNEDPVVPAESAPIASTGSQRERNMPVPRRSATQSSHYARPHEFRGDWHSEHDSRPHNAPAYRERQRHNVQYEYQPVGPSRGGNLEKHDMPEDRANTGSQRYGERGQSHPRRGGNYYRREGGGVRVESEQN